MQALSYFKKDHMGNAFAFHQVSDDLIFIRWTSTATHQDEVLFIKALQHCLNHAAHPLYFLSDLTNGCIVGIKPLGELGKLTQHRNWAGSTAFTLSMISRVYASSFRSLSRDTADKNTVCESVHEALAFLESLKPGVTADIDWERHFAD
ncbi:MAG: hypothetical protein SF123_11610 [Chloroflexota bacterium]|nr:hypothetical protein [Chloroflexota bacterium]